MGTCLKVLCFCVLITLTVQENLRKLRHRRGVNPTDVNPQDIVGDLSREIQNVGSKANGFESVQISIKEWVKERSDLHGDEIVRDIAMKLKARLEEKIDAVKQISNALARAFSNKRPRKHPYHRCCELPSKYKVTYDQRYKDKVTDALFCQMKAPAHLKEEDIDFTNVRTVFDKNKLKVKWQYFGSIEGISTMYPAARISTCGEYDNRLRPWYVTTATPSPKNIVILLDSSTSMGLHNTLDAVKDTAKIVVGTLNPQDKVSVILFNSSIFIRADNNTDECYDTTMPFAGTYTIKYLKSFINNARPIGGTRFTKAFKKAFEILKNTLKSSGKSIASRPSMIFLLTDGAFKESKAKERSLDDIKKEVERFKQEYPGTKFKLLALLFGDSKNSLDFITKLTQETDGTKMVASKETDPYSKLKAYFDYLMEVTPAKQSEVVFSPPYVDSWGLGFMVTAASAYFNGKNLRGVAGVDILMTDLLSDVAYFNQAGPKSYAFLFDAKSRYTISHPKLPIPEAITEDPNSVNILELEQGEEFKKLVKDVESSGRLREMTFKGRKRSISRGSMLGDGVQTEQVDYKYSCIPVDVRGLNSQEYIVCVALEKGDTDTSFKSLNIENQMSHAPVTYHRMDVLPTAQTCHYTDTLSYADRSVIKFSTRALEDPSKYLEDEDSPKAVKEYVEQLIGRVRHSEQSEIFAEEALVTAILTSLMDETWFNPANQKEYLMRFVRRYIGTYNGVLRLFPGAPLPTNFDHVSRPWFFRAVANEGSVSLTAPYLDPLGAGFIVSISETLKTSFGKENIFGVIGADLTVSTFGAMLRKRIGKKCLGSDNKLHCFIVDSNGYVVYHPNFDNAYNDSSKVLNKHITETDAEIARDMIKSKVMVRRACQNFNILKLQRFYEIKMDKDVHSSNKTSLSSCDSYAIIKVPETNVFVIETKGPDCFANRVSCPCHDTCTSNETDACECPCKSRLEYNFCNASLTGESDIPVCTQPSPVVPERAPQEHPADLGKCFSVHCGSYKTENDCNMVFGCFWCYTNMDGSLLKTPSCKSDRTCYGGMLGRGNPFLLSHKVRKTVKDRKGVFTILGLKLNKVTLIALAVALGVIVLISIATICCLCRRKNKFGEEFQTMDMFAVEEQPQLMGPTDVMTNDPAFGTLQLNYPGQSTVMQSNMQMSLRGPRLNYSTQAMSGMWAQGYAQSQLMSFGPQMSAIHTPAAYPRTLQSPSAMQASGAYPRTPKSPSTMRTLKSPSAMRTLKSPSAMRTLKSPSAMRTMKSPSAMRTMKSPSAMRTMKSPSAMRTTGAHPRTPKNPSAMQTTGAYPGTPNSQRSRPKKPRKVSFSNDEQYGVQEEPNAVFEDSSVAQGSEVAGNPATEEDGGL